MTTDLDTYEGERQAVEQLRLMLRLLPDNRELIHNLLGRALEERGESEEALGEAGGGGPLAAGARHRDLGEGWAADHGVEVAPGRREGVALQDRQVGEAGAPGASNRREIAKRSTSISNTSCPLLHVT